MAEYLKNKWVPKNNFEDKKEYNNDPHKDDYDISNPLHPLNPCNPISPLNKIGDIYND